MLVLTGSLLGWPALDAGATANPGLQRRRITVDGRRRAYYVHQPRGERSSSPRPAVVVLHGHGGTARSARRISRMDAKADDAGFIALYPEGSSWRSIPWRSWNAGHCCGYAMQAGLDDVAFLRAVIDDAVGREGIDPARVYVTGISNGGMMAYRLGCEHADRIAAIAPVAGSLGQDGCGFSGSVPAIVFHGTADDHVPYTGTARAIKDGRRELAVQTAVALWARANGCTSTAQSTTVGSVTQDTYCAGAAESEVILYTIEGGGHAWPGGARGWRFGASPTRDISATDLMWDFFERHSRSGQKKNAPSR